MNNIVNLEVPSMPSIPSIAASSMLVEVSISTYTGRKLDKRASEDVTSSNNAALGVANVHKKLLGNCTELDAIQKFVGNVRTLHYSMTMPWSDGGSRLLPTKQYFKYHKTMTGMQQEYEQLVKSFLSVYNWKVSQAQASLGDMWHRDDYPTEESLRGKFKFRIAYIPLPEVDDFRVDVGKEGNEQIRAHYKEYYQQQLEGAMGNVWQRVHTACLKISERLDYKAGEKKNIFRDTMVSNAIDLVELLKVSNITQDPEMDRTARKLSAALNGVTADALREDAHLRAQTKKSMDDVIKSLPSFDM
mgnify:FL=1